MQTADTAKPSQSVPPDALLSWEQLRALIPLSRPQIWRLRAAGQFPQPIRLSPNRIAWIARDVIGWINSRPAA